VSRTGIDNLPNISIFTLSDLTHPEFSRLPYLDEFRAEQSVLLSRGSLELLKLLGAPVIINTHNAQPGLIPVYMRAHPDYSDYFGSTKSVVTLHNRHQGQFEKGKYAIKVT